MIKAIIPTGHKNRISRESLRMLTGYSDRKNRRLIEQAQLEGLLIVSDEDNGGYFIPNPSDPADCVYARAYLDSELERAQTILNKCDAIIDMMHDMGIEVN